MIFTQLEVEFTQLHLLKFLCKFDHFPTRYRRKQKWVFFIEAPCIMLHSESSPLATHDQTIFSKWLGQDQVLFSPVESSAFQSTTRRILCQDPYTSELCVSV